MTDRYSAESLGALRIVTALLFILHGTTKLLGLPRPLPSGRVPLESLMGVAGILEMGGGLLVLIGLFARPTALVLAGEMAVAYFMAHAVKGFWPILNGGEPAILFCFAFLHVALAGGGAWMVKKD